MDNANASRIANPRTADCQSGLRWYHQFAPSGSSLILPGVDEIVLPSLESELHTPTLLALRDDAASGWGGSGQTINFRGGGK